MPLALVEDLKQFFESHSSELDHAAHAVEAVATNPAVQALLASAHIPDSLVQALADIIMRLDLELGAKAAAHAQAVADAHQAGRAEARAEAESEAQAAAAEAAAQVAAVPA